MSRIIAFVSTSALFLLVLSAACSEAKSSGANESQVAGKTTTKAICVLQPTGENKVRGTITFTQQDDGVLVEANITNLTPGLHGFHVHELGDITHEAGTCTGGHWNPGGKAHGGPDSAERHAGDLGNVEANAEGVATYSRVDRSVKLHGAESIVGRAIIVHADPDDLKSQPTGNAGARVAQGVIGIAAEK